MQIDDPNLKMTFDGALESKIVSMIFKLMFSMPI
jgi:hypothetical protein